MTEQHALREGLLALDSIDDGDREAYDRALRALFRRKFAPGERAFYVAATVGGAAVAMGLSTLALTEPATTPRGTRLLLGTLAGIGLFWCVVCGRALWSGSVGILADRRWIAWGALVFACLQGLFFAWRAFAADAQSGVAGVVVSAVFVVAAAGIVLRQLFHEARLAESERALRARFERHG